MLSWEVRLGVRPLQQSVNNTQDVIFSVTNSDYVMDLPTEVLVQAVMAVSCVAHLVTAIAFAFCASSAEPRPMAYAPAQYAYAPISFLQSTFAL